jgi:hypothetical protein
MTIAEIDAMSDQQVAELMGTTAEEAAAEDAWSWRVAAKAATDEYAERLAIDVESGRATVIADRPRCVSALAVGHASAARAATAPSMQVRARVTTGTRTALETIAAAQGRRLADVSRDALDYVARHAS